MYKVYFSPGACSVATQVILRELGQSFDIVNVSKAADFSSINPVGQVPVLVDNEKVLTEGAAIILYLLNKHPGHLLPEDGPSKQQAIQNIMLANATMHPAYGRLFFIAANLADGEAKNKAFEAATDAINALWEVVEDKLGDQPYLGGDQFSAADVLLAVYSRWGQFFPVNIRLGDKTSKMINNIINRDSFQQTLKAEEVAS